MATFENFDLESLVTMAYDIPRYRLSGPEWLATTKFDITARIPAGTTREQYRLMLQNLLTERFRLALHHDSKEMSIYELQVGKNGVKLTESPVGAASADAGLQPPTRMASPPRGYVGAVNLGPIKMSMERLTAILSGQLGQPVVDATGLTGIYEIKLQYNLALQASSAAGDASNPLPTVFDAIQQLGLKLVSKKAPVDILVVDHLEKIPTQN
jgi:uncharacterized protein (TIGR03435 family)